MNDLGAFVPIENKTKVKTGLEQTRCVMGPYGPLYAADLPPADTRRWVVRRKAEIVAAVRGGLLSRSDAMMRYSLTEEELAHWESLVDTGGLLALRAKQVQSVDRKAGLATEMLEFASAVDSVETSGCLSIDYAEESVHVSGALLDLTVKEYQVLELTILLRSDAVTKEAYLDYLYRGMNEPELKIIDVFMCKLRKKLKAATGVDFIENVWGRGYKFKCA